MAKNPNKSPEKGFQEELEKASELKPQQAKKKFTWHKPVSDAAAPQAMNTPRRMSEGKEVAPARSNYSNEMSAYLKDRAKKR